MDISAASDGEEIQDGMSDGDGSFVDSPALIEFSLESTSLWGRENGFGGAGDGLEDFRYPSGIALSRDETEVYVFDSGNSRIKVMNREGTVLRSWAHQSADCGGTSQGGVAVGLDGTVYVPLDLTHGIVGYAPDGTVRFEWVLQDVADYCTYDGHGHGLSVASNGDLLVAELGKGEVHVYTPSGAFVRTIGSRGRDKGQFAIGPDTVVEYFGRLYVTDLTRVMIFEPDGQFISYIHGPPDEPFQTLQFAMAVWSDWLIVGRAEDPPAFYAQSVRDVRMTHRWATLEGPLPGQLDYPWGVAIASDGTWYVTESYNHRVQVFNSSLGR